MGFNPRAREGRDLIYQTINVSAISFNPRAREGRDLFYNLYKISAIYVSIHAPVKGATWK